MPGAELRSSAGDGPVVVAVRGNLDMTGAADAGAAITALVVPGHCLIIDMPAVDVIDGGSLAALPLAQRVAWGTGADVVLAAPQRHVPRLPALAGRDHALLIQAGGPAAAAGLPGRGARHGGRPLAVSTACSGRAAPWRTGTGDRDRGGFLRGWMRGYGSRPLVVRGQVAAYASPAPAAELTTVNRRRRDAAIPPV
jgi:anti-anti-sigma regulatory factor